MAGRLSNELTTLEYIVLGLISLQPQSGYTIISYFENGAYGWSASPGSVYPMLKRLEKDGVILGKLEMEHEARARKVYTLSTEGEELLDEWLHKVPDVLPLHEQRELGLWRFQFMENRLSKRDVLTWLDAYLDKIRIYDYGRRLFQDTTLMQMAQLGKESVHVQLIMEATLMAINSHRTWLEMARTRIAAIAHQTGEFRQVDDNTP